jgi:soluble lytic murein transglycosylase-like protein/TolA-binding protein
MKIIRSWLFIVLALCGLFSTAFADGLDVFKTGNNFPTDFLFKEEIPNLETLKPDEIEPILKQFIDAKGRVESKAQNNLVHLGMSYLFLAQKEFLKAHQVLSHEFSGEFILEDFRIHFLTESLRGLAENNASMGKWDLAANQLGKALSNQLVLFTEFPSSPFHGDVPQVLAEIEIRLGKVYYNQGNYSAAWKQYSKVLERKYPGSTNDQLSIYLALARTYEADRSLNEAADIYIHLLNQYPSSKTRQEALEFLRNNLEALEKINGNAEKLKQLLKGEEKLEPPVKPIARKLPKWPQTNNSVIDNLFLALSMDDFPKILEYGEKVLKDFPGDENAKGVLDHVNKAIVARVSREGWKPDIDPLIEFYPVRYLSKLARQLWERGFPDEALQVYQKLLDKFPTETLACHKALFFMGRIEEDNHRYPEAIRYYEDLLEKYNWGYFTPSAQFKIPWLHRLAGHLEEAREGFIYALKYANPEKYRNSDEGFPEPDDFRPATLYWLAQTEQQLGNVESRTGYLSQLVEEFPMDFYTLVARMEMAQPPLKFLEPQGFNEVVARKWGLGDINRKKINRAEKLISIGFLERGMQELSSLNDDEDHQEFLYYIAQLFKKAGGFQKAIGLSWGISRRNKHSINSSLAEVLFPKPYLEDARRESAQYHLSPYLVLALMRQESAFNKKVVSSARAVGLMQILPTTAIKVARSLGEPRPGNDDLKKPEVNIQLGVKYLSKMLDDFNDNVIFALASYNAGPTKVKQWMDIRSALTPLEFMESIPYKETRNYVKKVLRNFVIYKTLYGEGDIHDFQGILTVRSN